MSCKNTNNNINNRCDCGYNVKTHGVSDLSRININGGDRTSLNWSEISVPEILPIPYQKPDIETLDQVYVNAVLTSVKLIETPFAYKRYSVTATAAQITAVTALLTPLTNVATALWPAIYTAPVPPATTPTGLLGVLLYTTIPAAYVTAGLTPTPAVTTAIDAVNTAAIGVDTAVTALTDAIATVTSILALGTDLTTSLLCSTLKELLKVIQSLVTAVNALLTALATLISLLPQAVSIIVLTAYNAIVTAINTILTNLTNSITAITDFLATLITAYIEIISNEEGTCLTGRKLVIEGFLKQKVVYTANVSSQSVHSAHFTVPFSAFVIPYANFEGLTYMENVEVTPGVFKNVFAYYGCDATLTLQPILCEEFSVEVFVEDIFAYALDDRTVFKNTTLFFLAKVSRSC